MAEGVDRRFTEIFNMFEEVSDRLAGLEDSEFSTSKTDTDEIYADHQNRVEEFKEALKRVKWVSRTGC